MTTDADFDAELLAQMREDFLVESQEILMRLGFLLTQLEQQVTPELVNTIFREMHTLKGTAGFVGLDSIRRLAHRLEDLFGLVRTDQLTVTPELIDVVFDGLATLTALCLDFAANGTGEGDISAPLARVEAALHGGAALAAPPAAPPPAVVPPPAASKAVPEAPPAPLRASASPREIEPAPPAIPPHEPAPAAPATTPTSETTLRVEVETIDTLMVLVGELITARNALTAHAERLRDQPLLDSVLGITRLTQQLQNTVSTVRLVPIERLFNRFTPVVRNLARERGKQVQLLSEGGDTPLDRTVSEQMYDPLIHLLRNAIDHGLEPTPDRRRAGKPEQGTIRLSASRRGDHVLLRISDDGAGINVPRIRRVAVERGLYTAEAVSTLTDDQAMRLIFAPGFSTAGTVTDISGRGVGMDVVLQNVRRLRGSIDIETAPGEGTTFTLQLPLTLAILQVLLVRAAGHVYALPLYAVRETLRLPPSEIQAMQAGQITFLRGTPLPVWHLAELLKLAPAPPSAPVASHTALVARLPRGDQVVIVDELIGKHQMVIKPLSPYLGTVPGVEGAAILQDGSVTLVLNLDQLIF